MGIIKAGGGGWGWLGNQFLIKMNTPMRLLDLPNLYTLFRPRPIKLFQYGRHFGKREVPIVLWPFKQCDMTVHIYI